MKNEATSKSESAFCVLLLVYFFAGMLSTTAQKTNQFDENRKRTGLWKKYHPNKRIRYIGTFEAGKEIGTFKYFDISTSKHPTIIKEFSKTSDTSKVRYFNLQGQLSAQGKMVKKARVGPWNYYFPSGELFSEEYYVDGKLEGQLINYYSNGQKLEVTNYANGMKNGVSKNFSDLGVLIEEVHYKDDRLNGQAKYYELNGNLKEEGSYKDGKKVGEWEFYIEGKKVSKERQRAVNKFNKNETNR